MEDLKISPEFRDKIPRLTKDEYEQLKANILEDGEVREPIVVWSDTIIDGHNRWKIIQEHPEIPHKIKRMDFADRWAAIAWMCQNQMGRRNITNVQKTVLIGEAYEAQKKSVGNHAGKGRNADGKFTVHPQNENIRAVKRYPRTCDLIADEFGVNSSTVQKAANFVRGLNAADEVAPGFRDAVLSGKVKAPQIVIGELRKLPEESRKAEVEKIRGGKPQAQGSKIGYTQEQRKLNKIINDVVTQLYDAGRIVERTAEHASEDMTYIVDDFVKKARRSVANHASVLQDAESKAKVVTVLERALIEVQAIKEELKNDQP